MSEKAPNPYGDMNDATDWESMMGMDRTDEIDRINAEEEEEIKNLYPGDYDEENVESERFDEASEQAGKEEGEEAE